MKTVNLDKVISHCRERAFMSGVERDRLRIKSTGECFTPTPLVQQILDKMPKDLFIDPTNTILDPTCGDGQFLSEVLIRKMENGSTFEQALGTIYGVDLMPDNVKLCQDRLLCGREDLRGIVEKNIVCADGLRYHYRFDGSPPYLSDKDLKLQSMGLGTLVALKNSCKPKAKAPIKEAEPDWSKFLQN